MCDKDLFYYNMDKLAYELSRIYCRSIFEKFLVRIGIVICIFSIFLKSVLCFSTEIVLFLEIGMFFLAIVRHCYVTYKNSTKKNQKRRDFLEIMNIVLFPEVGSIEPAIELLNKFNINTREDIYSCYSYYNSIMNKKNVSSFSSWIPIIIAFFTPFFNFNKLNENLFIAIWVLMICVIMFFGFIRYVINLFRIVDYERINMLLFTIYIHYDVLEEKLIQKKMKSNSKLRKDTKI